MKDLGYHMNDHQINSHLFRNLLVKIITYGKMIKFSHTIFALPFALSAVILAQRIQPISFSDVCWIIIAMVGARSAAMGVNRVADEQFDKKNPRTATREIPSGKISKYSAILFICFFSCLFIFASAMLDTICLIFSIPVLFLLFLYSWTKRFTWLSHLYLGFVISLAPIGAWVAVAKTFSGEILFLSLALMTYIAGFDILYACQDTDFDKQEGLYSIPVRFGSSTALSIAALLHTMSFLFFIFIYFAFDLQWIYLITVAIIGMLFLLEHHLIKPDDLTHIQIAFFHVNSIISVMVFIGIFSDEVLRRWN